MASSQTIVYFITDQIALPGRVRTRKMFGEYALYCDEKVVALICDDQLFVKPTTAGEKYLKQPELAPPYPGAKSYFLISGDWCEDRDWLTELISLTAAELPVPKPKKPKSRKS